MGEEKSMWELIMEASESLSGVPLMKLEVKNVIPVNKRIVRKNTKLLLEYARQEYQQENGLERWMSRTRNYNTGIVVDKKVFVSLAPHLSKEEKISTYRHELGHLWCNEVLNPKCRTHMVDFFTDQVKKKFFPWLLPDHKLGTEKIAREAIAWGYAISISRRGIRKWIIQDALAYLADYFNSP